MKVPSITLNNGVEMPVLGLGVYQIDDLNICKRTVSDALDLGYRLIDTAAVYENESAVGAAIRSSSVRREDIFVTSKLWVQDFGYERALRGFERSLDKLGLDYIDLYLLHKPYGDYYGAWRALEKLYKEGRVRAIGVTSFWNERLADLCHFNEVTPALNQVETNVWWQQWPAEEFMKKMGICHQTWAPFAEGFGDVFHNPLLERIALKHSRTTAQVMLRFFLQCGIAVIPKTVHRERLAENIDVFGFSLDEEDMKAIRTLDNGRSLLSDDMDVDEALSMIEYTFE